MAFLTRLANGVRRRTRRGAKKTRKKLREILKRARALRAAVQHVADSRHRASYAASLTKVPSRRELPEVLNRRGLVCDAAEVGVKAGAYSEFLLDRWRGRRLISIDPWQEAEPSEYVDHANVRQDEHDEFYERTRRRLDRYGSRSEIRRQTSLAAADEIPDGSLDFVYIDARHDYPSVLEDLAAWLPKMRPGGLIAGHDYVDGSFESGEFGVKSAVDEFFRSRGLRVYSTRGKEPAEMFPSWIVEIPS
jgi:hypothetical protein